MGGRWPCTPSWSFAARQHGRSLHPASVTAIPSLPRTSFQRPSTAVGGSYTRREELVQSKLSACQRRVCTSRKDSKMNLEERRGSVRQVEVVGVSTWQSLTTAGMRIRGRPSPNSPGRSGEAVEAADVRLKARCTEDAHVGLAPGPRRAAVYLAQQGGEREELRKR